MTGTLKPNIVPLDIQVNTNLNLVARNGQAGMFHWSPKDVNYGMLPVELLCTSALREFQIRF